MLTTVIQLMAAAMTAQRLLSPQTKKTVRKYANATQQALIVVIVTLKLANVLAGLALLENYAIRVQSATGALKKYSILNTADVYVINCLYKHFLVLDLVGINCIFFMFSLFV